MESQRRKLIESEKPRHSHHAASPMRILVDARKLGDGGIGTYTANLISGLLELGREVTLISTKEKVAAFRWSADVTVIEDDTPRYSLQEYLTLPRRIPFEKFDLFHVPHYTLPFRVPIPTVVTIHDLIHVTHPERGYYPWVAKPLVCSALSRAARVIAVSRSTADEIAALGVFARPFLSKVRVVPNAVSPAFLEVSDAAALGVPRIKTHGRYFFSVASQSKPHKGVHDMIEAFIEAKRRLRERGDNAAALQVKLLLSGFGTTTMVEEGQLLEQVIDRRDIHLLGRLSQEDQISYYAGASAVLVPSRAEGFGLPLLEGHALGTPAIMRPVAALKELATRFDRIADDMSIAALSEAMQAAMSDPGELSPIEVEELRKSARKFSCHEVARATLQVYQEASEAQRPLRRAEGDS